MNGHDEDLEIMNENFQHFLATINNDIYRMVMTLSNHCFGSQMLTKGIFSIYNGSSKTLEIYTPLPLEVFSAPDTFLNVRLRHQKIDPVTLERYLRTMAYDLKKS